MKIRVKVLVTFLLGAVLAGSFQASGQAKLNDVISYALEHSRDVKKANYQIEEAKYVKRETLGRGLPQIEASGSYSKMSLPEISLPQELVAMVPEQYAPMLAGLSNLDALYTASAGIQVTQLIYSQAFWVGLKTAQKAQELYSIFKNKKRRRANC